MFIQQMNWIPITYRTNTVVNAGVIALKETGKRLPSERAYCVGERLTKKKKIYMLKSAAECSGEN